MPPLEPLDSVEVLKVVHRIATPGHELCCAPGCERRAPSSVGTSWNRRSIVQCPSWRRLVHASVYALSHPSARSAHHVCTKRERPLSPLPRTPDDTRTTLGGHRRTRGRTTCESRTTPGGFGRPKRLRRRLGRRLGL